MSHDFQKHRLYKKRRTRLLSFMENIKPQTLTAMGIIVVVLFLAIGLFRFVAGLPLENVLNVFSFFVGKDLKTDDFDHTNILLLGVGGKGHDGEDLTDTIILASIDHKTPFVTLISIPRDLYVETERLGGSRINKIYELGKKKYDSETGLEVLREAVESVAGIPVHYYVKVDFSTFEKVIDAIGGIDMYIDETIDDPFYPKDGTYDYEPFYLPAGNRHLDGKTALKYVRSRKTSSDFERSFRQQKLLKAVKDKIRSSGLASDTRFLKRLYGTVEDDIEMNLGLRELVSLAEFGTKVSEDSFLDLLLHDDPNRRGGFLYSPLRKLYGGAYVLLPAGDDFEHVQNFTKLASYYHAELENPTSLQILNGTPHVGLAGGTKVALQRYGFLVSRFGNGRDKNQQKTTIYYKDAENPPAIIDLLKIFIPAEVSSDIPREYVEPPYESDAQVVVELGEDFLPAYRKLDIYRNIVPLTPEGEPAPADDAI